MTWMLLAACTPKPEATAPTDPTTPSSSTTSSPTPTTPADTAATTPTGDTATTTVPPGLIYPEAPYDCGLGVPAGEPAVRRLTGITTTEALTFDLDGYLVAWDAGANVVQYAVDGSVQVLAPNAGEAKGIDLLNDGDIAYTHGTLPQLRGVDHATGAPYLIAELGGAGSYCDIDVASDGTVVTGDLSGDARIVEADGTVVDFGRIAVQLYGAAFSVSEDTAYWSGYSQSDPWIFRSERGADGTWSQPTRWVEIEDSTLSGMAVDACDNLQPSCSPSAAGCTGSTPRARSSC
ncbi:MAG: hypothetical protein R3F59_13025 [Myxococcota bacterium]